MTDHEHTYTAKPGGFGAGWLVCPCGALKSECATTLRQELADLRATLECSQVALGQAVTELERAQARAADMELQRDQSLVHTPCFECGHS